MSVQPWPWQRVVGIWWAVARMDPGPWTQGKSVADVTGGGRLLGLPLGTGWEEGCSGH